MREKCDFSGWATKNDLLCTDGVIIRKDAFKDQNGTRVPLVWMHQHNDPENTLGHAILENREDGVYAYCYLNSSDKAKHAKELVQHGDVDSLSIWANNLRKQGNNVMHGTIRELSLVLAGANSGARIDYPQLVHANDFMDDEDISEAYITTGDLIHADVEKDEEAKEEKKEEAKEEMPAKEKTVKDVFDELTEEQKNVVYFMIGQALEEAGATNNDDKEDDEEVKHSVFENYEAANDDYISQDAMNTIFTDAKKSSVGSLRDSFLMHATEYGIDNIEWLFPDAKELNNKPGFISRDMEWVSVFMNGVGHSPFARIKTTFADITADEARAKGYIKGNQKADEVITLARRTTTPQTIYKRQRFDRDDIIDIVDFDTVAWIKAEMRVMLNEEIARACLIGDGRSAAATDKISEDHVRPIATDASLFTIYTTVSTAEGATDAVKAKAFIKAAVKARKYYKGSGNTVLFTTEDWLNEMLLLEDTTERPLYDDVNKLATKLRVKKIVTAEVLENASVHDADLMGIIVDLNDYRIGADKGGAINMFDDFDIDFNQLVYLMETRISGCLVKPKSAIVLTDGAISTDSSAHGVEYSTSDDE